MITIDIKELENSIDKYIELGQKEEIEITKNGDTIFYITPKRIELMRGWETFFGTLPDKAYSDEDISRE